MRTLPPVARPSSYSVRQRLTTAVAVLTALALIGAGFAVYAVEIRRLDQAIEREMSQEFAEFRTLQSEGEDPRTGRPFTSADRLLAVFLDRNLPTEHEMLFAFPTTGRPKYQGPSDPGLQQSTEFTDTVADLGSTGGTRTISLPSGRYVVAVLPVREGSQSASFVVVQNLSEARQELRDVIATYAVVATLSLALVTLLASLLARRLLRPVRRLRETASEIAEGSFARRIEVSGNDDLTDLSVAFNQMLDRLESAFSSQRQLLDDVGHELRTPLTILRGHLELVDPHDPDDVAAARTLLLDETDRMARLVDDLLVLAKARRPDFIEPAAVDLEQLTEGLYDKCRALGPRRWAIDERAATTAVLDGQRITQAMLQLADNAVRHTGEEDEIAIGSRFHRGLGPGGRGLVEFWVRDTGPGVREEDRERVFERFQRGTTTGDGDGFGLGLSIVSAIAGAHGGRVRLTSPPSEDVDRPGASFEIVVPAEPETRREAE